MAILHRAWTFDAPSAAARIAAIVRDGGEEALRETAHRIVAAGDPDTAAALAQLAFDPEWLEPPDEMSSRDVQSMVIILASQFTRAPAVTGHVVLRRALLDRGWMPAGVDLLLRGRWLHTMFDVSSDPELARSIVGINQYGGWIPRADAAALRLRLDALPSLPDAAEALAEARAMLDVAARRGADLYVILD